MRIPKTYGQSKLENCPFCGKRAVTSNVQRVPTCVTHKKSELVDLRCVCGDYLDIIHGKYGPFAKCMNCGAMNMRKALEINPNSIKAEVKEAPVQPKKREEITVRSDELDLLY
jgi:hypothetical protein